VTDQETSLDDWSPEQVEQVAAEVCPPDAITELLASGRGADRDAIGEILLKARDMDGLAPEQVACLIQVDDPDARAEIMDSARHVHETAYGRRIAISTPVCPTNRCINDCLYCPLRRSNTRLRRTSSTVSDLQREVTALLREGHRQLNLVFGDDRSGIHYVRDMMLAASGTRSGIEQVVRVDLNINAMQPAQLHELTTVAALGTYHAFQETYHPETYARLHPDGPKSNFAWRISCHDRTHQAGIHDVGLGVLLGAYDYRYDVVAILNHAQYLTARYGEPPTAITYPRLVSTSVAPASQETRWQVRDDDFVFIAAVTRLAAPRTAIVLCTPVMREVRRDLYGLGVSEVSVGSLSYPGAYTADGDPEVAGALTIARPRAMEMLVYRLCEAGFVPDLCSTQRSPRDRVVQAHGALESTTAERRAANSLLSLREYTMDYASPDTKRVADAVVQRELARLPRRVRSQTLQLMVQAEAGLRRQTL